MHLDIIDHDPNTHLFNADCPSASQLCTGIIQDDNLPWIDLLKYIDEKLAKQKMEDGK